MNQTPHPAALPDCPQCRGAGLVVGPGRELAEARVCDCVGICPECRGTGFVGDRHDRRAPRRRCSCQGLHARIRAFNEIRLPARHAHSTRVSFDASGKTRTVGFLKVSSWLQSWREEGPNEGLVLWGDVGRGKTHLMVALLRELVLVKGVRARFIEFSHLLADLKAGFDVGRGMASLLDPLVHVDVLGIDELGKGMRTDFELTVIDELISRRYNGMLPTLATTNYRPGPAGGPAVVNAAEVALGTARAPTLADRVGERVFSRLQETSRFVHLQGEDWRATHRGRRPR